MPRRTAVYAVYDEKRMNIRFFIVNNNAYLFRHNIFISTEPANERERRPVHHIQTPRPPSAAESATSARRVRISRTRAEAATRRHATTPC